ncbi:MAG: MAPEG family protein [Gammaproteobacteria bacterium]|nr:MAPEG family protein [Gammaproteobacteria bacterium]
MTQASIFAPLFVLVLHSYVIGLLLLHERNRAVRNGLPPAYFRYNRGAKPPESLLSVTQHYQNLFELPLLFYVLCLALYATGLVDALNLGLAWAFVIGRLLHAYIHIVKNRLLWRRNIFLFSSGLLLLMWLEFGLRLFVTA